MGDQDYFGWICLICNAGDDLEQGDWNKIAKDFMKEICPEDVKEPTLCLYASGLFLEGYDASGYASASYEDSREKIPAIFSLCRSPSYRIFQKFVNESNLIITPKTHLALDMPVPDSSIKNNV